MSKSLVAYFSASGVTKEVSNNLATAAEADLFEIRPVVLYTEADLNWMDKNARSTIEMKDKSFRPEVAEKYGHMEEYNTIYLGFPIWWYVAPTIINTFLEQYDMSGKTIILFATSGGSGLGKTATELKISVTEKTIVKEGGVLNGTPSVQELKKWITKI